MDSKKVLRSKSFHYSKNDIEEISDEELDVKSNILNGPRKEYFIF